jgi:nitrogenase-stabilizing/protective protein
VKILDKLRSATSAEEFFRLLDVPFDPKVVSVCRLHILKRLGLYLREVSLEGLQDAEVESACRDQLERAYRDFVASSPIQERVFKVLQDAVRPKTPSRPSLVQLSVAAR